MKAKEAKEFSTLVLILAILVFVWIALLVLTTRDVGSEWGDLDYLLWIRDPGLAAFLSYFNALLITVFTVMLFGGLYTYFRRKGKAFWLWAGILFVPVYGILNLVVYGTQILFLPQLIQHYADSLTDAQVTGVLIQFVQMKSGTFFAFLNGLAYAILGIPSLIYGIQLLKSRNAAKVSGMLFILNAVACFIGLIGMAANNSMLAVGTLAGGVLFFLGLLFLFAYLRSKGMVRHDLPE